MVRGIIYGCVVYGYYAQAWSPLALNQFLYNLPHSRDEGSHFLRVVLYTRQSTFEGSVVENLEVREKIVFLREEASDDKGVLSSGKGHLCGNGSYVVFVACTVGGYLWSMSINFSYRTRRPSQSRCCLESSLCGCVSSRNQRRKV